MYPLDPFIEGKIDDAVKGHTSPTLARASMTDNRLMDPIYRLSTLYKIINKEGEEVTFDPNIFQLDILTNWHNKMIVTKARQLGISTFVAIVALDQCLFNSNFAAAMVADKKANASNLFDRFKHAWETLDQELKDALGLETESDSKTYIKFSNGSSAKVDTSIHSGTYQLLHVSEFGPLCRKSHTQARALLKSALPTVSKRGTTIIESTAEGEGDPFHELVQTAEADTQRAAQEGRPLHMNEWKSFFFPWFLMPEYEYDNAVKRNANGDSIHLFASEHIAYRNRVKDECGYELTDGQLIYAATKMAELKNEFLTQYPATLADAFKAHDERYFDGHLLDIVEKEDATAHQSYLTLPGLRFPGMLVDPSPLLVWQPYNRGHVYAIGADVSAGVGRDSSSAVIIDFTTKEVVATYRSNTIKPEDFSYELRRFGSLYGNCLVAPEVNLVGYTTCIKLKEIYNNIHYHVIEGYSNDVQTERIGFLTNANTKRKFLEDLDTSLRAAPENRLKVRDVSIIQEMRMYTKKDSFHRAETAQTTALKTRHYDLLIATAIAWQMRDHVSSAFQDDNAIYRVENNREKIRQGKRSMA